MLRDTGALSSWLDKKGCAERTFPGEEQAGGSPWLGQPLCSLGNPARQAWSILWAPILLPVPLPWEALLALLRGKEEAVWPGGVPGGPWLLLFSLLPPRGSLRGSPPQQPSLLLHEMGFLAPPFIPFV